MSLAEDDALPATRNCNDTLLAYAYANEIDRNIEGFISRWAEGSYTEAEVRTIERVVPSRWQVRHRVTAMTRTVAR